MKKLYILFLLCSVFSFSQNVTITKVIETGCADPFLKTVELYVDGTVDFATEVVVNLQTNSNTAWNALSGTDALGSVTDSFVYLVRDVALMQTEFPSITFDDTPMTGNTAVVGASTNGDDRYQVVLNGTVVSQFGEDSVDGTGTAWEHLDAVATRLTGLEDNGTWNPTHWSITAVNSLDDQTACQGVGTNLETYFATLGDTFPLSSGSGWTPTGASCTASLGASDTTCDSTTSGTTDDTYTATLAYSGAATGETFIVTATEGTVDLSGGNDPTNDASGVITVTGITEGTDITITLDNTADSGLCTLTSDITSPVCLPTGSIDLELQGVLDFTIVDDNYMVSGAQGKGVHVVATADIADLSVYGLGVANNGGGTDGQEYTFDPIAVNSGDHILIVRSLQAMEDYFTTAGYNLFDFVLLGNNSISQNGDDAIELYKNNSVVETFGDINTDGSGETWEYLDSWAYKTTLGAVWPAGWSYGTINCTDGTATTFDSTCVYPFLSALSNEEFTTSELSIYPNPTNSGIVNIKSQIAGIKSISLFDVMGRNVLSTELNSDIIDVSSVRTGMYLLKVSINGRSSITKLIIK